MLYRKYTLSDEAIDRFDTGMSAMGAATDDKAAQQALQKAVEPVRSYINVEDGSKENSLLEGQNAMDEDDVSHVDDGPSGKPAPEEGGALRFVRPNESTSIPSPCSELTVSDLPPPWREFSANSCSISDVGLQQRVQFRKG